MRIGTIAQHANIGPTNPNSIFANIIPGRLNDFPIWAWWDFTDPIAVGGGPTNSNTAANATENLQQCDDKGPNNVWLSADSTTKGPQYFTNGGQDNYGYIKAFNSEVDYMLFTNPEDISSRKFTATIIFDMNSTSIGSANQYFFKLNGSSNSTLEFYWYSTMENLFVGLNKDGHTARFAYATSDDDDIDGQTGGDYNYNFNWVTLVLETDGTIKLYMRGKPITLYQSGTFSDTVIASKGTLSHLFEKESVGEPVLQLHSSIYEVMMFNDSLSNQQLYNIDMYIKNKYSSYSYGRINGY